MFLETRSKDKWSSVVGSLVFKVTLPLFLVLVLFSAMQNGSCCYGVVVKFLNQLSEASERGLFEEPLIGSLPLQE